MRDERASEKATRCWATVRLELGVFGEEPTDEDVRDAVAASVEFDGLDTDCITVGVGEAPAPRSEEGPDKPGAPPPARPASPGSPRGAVPDRPELGHALDRLGGHRLPLGAEGLAAEHELVDEGRGLPRTRRGAGHHHGLEKAKADLSRTHAALGAPKGWTSAEYARALRRAVDAAGLGVVCTTDQDGKSMSTEIEIPESNRWEDFVWPEWVPERERELVEDFWSKRNGRGPKQWAENAVAPYNNGIQTGTRARMWSRGESGRILVEGRFVHRWNNIGAIVLDDGTSVYASGVATEESIEEHKAHVASRLANRERELERLRAEAAALGVEVGS